MSPGEAIVMWSVVITAILFGRQLLIVLMGAAVLLVNAFDWLLEQLGMPFADYPTVCDSGE